MNISTVTAAAQNDVSKISSPSTARAALASAVEEASESAATTRQEAARGDKVAIRKLARLQQSGQTAESKPVQESGKGDSIDRSV